MVAPLVVLVPSPFLKPASWQPVADVLRAGGHDVTIAPSNPSRRIEDASRVLGAILDGVPPGREVVLVPHSNAGLYVGHVACERDVTGIVFVDAGIPVEAGPQPLAPAGLLEHLADRTDASGVLPGWTGWFAEDAVAPLFPDPATRSCLEAGQPRVAMTYLRSSIDVPHGWSDLPSAYLAFGETYDVEQERAQSLGWPVTRLDGAHLHQLFAPTTVAEHVVALADL